MPDRVIRIDKEKKKRKKKKIEGEKRRIIEKEDGGDRGKKKKKTGRKIKRTTIFIFASLQTVSPITSNFFQRHV